jgi:aminoglycoside 3-N-acetyltransferase
MNEGRGQNVIVDKSTIVAGLKNTGLKRGDVVLVHSAMRTIGRIERGAKTVVEALLEAVGPQGTLVAPTFVFMRQRRANPVIDPAVDHSEMGAISEEIRRHPEALHSIAYRHSVAAIGRRARVITEVDPRLSPFDPRGSFDVMLTLNA